MQAPFEMASEFKSVRKSRSRVGGLDRQKVLEVQHLFRAQGVNLREWAKANEAKEKLVYEVFSGRRSCLRGESHRIAVLMGLKPAPGADLN